MSKALDAIAPGVLKILDTHDRFALRHRSFLQAGQTPQWFSTSVAEETAGLRRADFVVAIQEQEAEIFSRQLGAGHTQVVTVGHLLSVQQRIVPATTSSAVFLASDNPINVDGAQYFIDNVLPLVRREKADFRFILAGDVGNKAGAGNGAVVRLGRVDSVADAFRNAALSVNPVRMGTGLNIKMLEALACGVACVSSQTGSRGLERYHQQAFATVPDNDPGVMAQAVLRLLNDRPAAVRLADAGLRLVQEWNAVQLSGLVRVLAAATANVQSPLSRCNVA
jgi:glycosyltransferase involved in cell wall biosynthesis